MKKYALTSAIFCLVSFFLTGVINAQDAALTAEFKQSTIEQISELLNRHYVFPDVAKTTMRWVTST